MELKASWPTFSRLVSAVKSTSLNFVPAKALAPIEVMLGLEVKSRVPEDEEPEVPKDKEEREERN